MYPQQNENQCDEHMWNSHGNSTIALAHIDTETHLQVSQIIRKKCSPNNGS